MRNKGSAYSYSERKAVSKLYCLQTVLSSRPTGPPEFPLRLGNRAFVFEIGHRMVELRYQ